MNITKIRSYLYHTYVCIPTLFMIRNFGEGFKIYKVVVILSLFFQRVSETFKLALLTTSDFRVEAHRYR